jgi:hypothetical protein
MLNALQPNFPSLVVASDWSNSAASAIALASVRATRRNESFTSLCGEYFNFIFAHRGKLSEFTAEGLRFSEEVYVAQCARKKIEATEIKMVDFNEYMIIPQ